MRIDLRYECRYRYGAEVADSHNAARICPAEAPTQRLLSYRIDVDPGARILSYVDYWGTRVDTFGVAGDHRELVIVAEASVETERPREPSSDSPWRGPRPLENHLDAIELLSPSPHVRWGSEVAAFAADAAAGASTLVDAAAAVSDAVSHRMTYERGATDVGTPVDEVFESGRGVCQDYAHLALACYRSLGIPARYVSGYVADGEAYAGVETHAWVEVLVDGHGWWGLDPTNRVPADERHVKIGHGRDYEDLTPLRGVYSGSRADAELAVEVSTSSEGIPLRPSPPETRSTTQ